MNSKKDESRLDIDYSERTGFLTGKSAALAEWSHKKDAREFRKLVNRLRVRKWQRENPEKKRAKQRAHARKQTVKERGLALARKRRENRPVEEIVCLECHEKFPKSRSGPRPKFCGAACRSRAKYHEKHPDAQRCKRHDQRHNKEDAERLERASKGKSGREPCR